MLCLGLTCSKYCSGPAYSASMYWVCSECPSFRFGMYLAPPQALRRAARLRESLLLWSCMPPKNVVLRTLVRGPAGLVSGIPRSEEHTSELQSLRHLVCRLLLEKK